MIVNVNFECTVQDAARIQKCVWHGFYDLCNGGFNGESQVNEYQSSCFILDHALCESARKVGSNNNGVYITEKDAYWILGLMKRVERAGAELCGKDRDDWSDGPKNLRDYLKTALRAREKCRKDHKTEEIK